MKNSDLFLELFDDDLLKPQNEVVDAKKIDRLPADLNPDKIISEPSSSKGVVRTEFDICAALDKEKDEIINKKYDNEKSLIHTGDTDSSDDEDNKYMDSFNYDNYGREVKQLLSLSSKKQPKDDKDCVNGSLSINEEVKVETSYKKDNSLRKKNNVKQMSLPEKSNLKSFDVYADPIFGLRIVTPLISSQGIQIRMSGKTPVFLDKLRSHMAKNVESDFVVAGVIVRSITKQSQNDNNYMIWDISDLKGDLLSVPVFLFGQSYKDLWKTQIGTVVAILNPTGGNKKGTNGNESFSILVKFSDQVMIWGHSKDYGICKSIKKNGEKCSMFVNRSRCEFCTYHVKKEYSKFSSSRSEIQSSMGCGDINFLRNKVLGKNEVFYGGKSYMAVKAPTEKAKEQAKKLNPIDQQRLTNLGVKVLEPKTETKNKTFSLPLAPRAALALKSLNMDSKILESLSLPNEEKGTRLKNTKSSCTTSSMLSEVNQKVPQLSNPKKDKSTKQSKLKLEDQTLKPINSNSINPSKCDNTVNNLNRTLLKFPSLSNPENDSISNLNKSEVVSKRSQMLFEEAVSEKESPKMKTNKSIKLSSNKSFNKLKADINVKKDDSSKRPILSDPSDNFFESTMEKSQHTYRRDRSKELQTRFKSLLDIECCEKPKTTTTLFEISTSNSKQPNEDMDNTKTKNEENVTPGNDESKKSDDCLSKPVVNQAKNDSSSSSLQERDAGNFYKSLPVSVTAAKVSKAKARALMFVKRNGPLTKVDPNAIKKTPETSSRKRERSDSHEESKDGKMVFSDLYLQLMKETSAQQDLVEAEKLRVEEEYFEKMGLKEQLEEKMLNTYKIDCKAVKCIQCKYIWFSAADLCKSERHTLKIVDTVKRFFKCGNCGNRTVSLHVLPMFSCKNCSSSNWQRAPMMREKIVKMDNQLSIRGGEQQFFNSQITNTNLNLIVPD